MPHTCFVIMPFSDTRSCTEDEWTEIFEDIFKPAVEGAGLDYECRRSVATRGNVVAAILQDLNDAYLVLADLTDRNANVFYELGVRHSLKDRSILLAQKEEDIPFDLHAYAYHVYDWRTEEGRDELVKKLRQLLAEVHANPDRPDNPVSDFLRGIPEAAGVQAPVSVVPEEAATAQPLVGPAAEGLNAVEFARKLAHAGAPRAANTVLRLTRREFQPLIKQAVVNLNKIQSPDQVPNDQITTLAQQYITKVEPLIQNVEQFVLSCVEEGWEAGTRLTIKFAGDWISLSEGQTIQGNRMTQGVFSLLALRLLILSGAKTLTEETFDLLGIILRETIEVESLNGRFRSRSFVQQSDLFYSEAFLGHAGHSVKYIEGLWKNQPHLHEFFISEKDYHFAVAQFLIVVALATQTDDKIGTSLYPAYSRFPQARRAMSSFCSRLASSEPYLEKISQAIGFSGEVLRETWSERVKVLNSKVQETERFPSRGVMFPDPMDENVSEF